MSQYKDAKKNIDSKINTNGKQAITGAILNDVLTTIVNVAESGDTELNKTLATVNENVAKSIETLNKNVADGFNTINGGIDNEIRPAVKKNTEDIAGLQKTVITVNQNLADSVEAINKNVADGFNTINGGLDNEIRPAIEKNASAIDSLKGASATKEEIATVNQNLVTAIDSINKNVADGFNTINGGIDNEIRPAIKTLQENLATVNQNLADAITAINQNVADGFNTINGGIENEVKPEIKAVKDSLESYQKKLVPGVGVEITEDNTINVTLDNSIFKVVDEFPEKPDAKDAGKIFVVANPEGESGNSFVEKIYVDGKWETVGEFKPEVDLTPYLKITVVDGKQVAVLPENAQIMGTLGAGIYALLSLRDYGEGVVQVEVGTATQHLCLNSKDRVTVDTADGKKEFAYLTDMPDLEPYALKTEVPSIEGLATEASVVEVSGATAKLATDVDYIGNTLIPEMNTNTAKALNAKVDWDETKSVISLPANGSISAMRGEPAEGIVPEGGVLLCQRTYDSGTSYVTEVGTVKNHLTINSTDRPSVDTSDGQEKVAYLTDIPDLEPYATKTECNEKYQPKGDYALKSELPDVMSVGMFYPGVKVDSQKLFALTKESTEDEIKAALKIATASGGYTLPTSKILDDCLGKGYQLLSNWMPVSIAWNGAAYVFYTVGQNYMMKPTGLYTVAIRVTPEGQYSVFQAAKVEEFASVEDIPSIENLADKDSVEAVKTIAEKAASDVDYVGNTLIPEMNTNTAKALATKVDWDETKSVISLPANGSISAMRGESTEGMVPEGGVLLCQRTYDSGTSYVTEVGTVKNHLTINSNDRPSVDTEDGQEKVAYLTDMPREIPIPIRTLENRVYTQDEIFGWFGVEDLGSLRHLFARGPLCYLRFGLSLSFNPYYYRFPIHFMSMDDANTIVLKFVGLNTLDDVASKYTITIKLDGTAINNKCNVKVAMLALEPKDAATTYIEAK